MIRKALIKDAPEIHALVESFASNGEMLRRPISEIYTNIRAFYVFEDAGRVIGTCALHVCLETLGEVRSLAVKESGRGVGSALVAACIEEAKELGLERVFALTYAPDFFEKMGFTSIDKEDLPHKIWGECINCSKFPNCDENAVIIDL